MSGQLSDVVEAIIQDALDAQAELRERFGNAKTLPEYHYAQGRKDAARAIYWAVRGEVAG